MLSPLSILTHWFLQPPQKAVSHILLVELRTWASERLDKQEVAKLGFKPRLLRIPRESSQSLRYNLWFFRQTSKARKYISDKQPDPRLQLFTVLCYFSTQNAPERYAQHCPSRHLDSQPVRGWFNSSPHPFEKLFPFLHASPPSPPPSNFPEIYERGKYD